MEECKCGCKVTYLSTKQVAARWNVTEPYIRNLRYYGKGPEYVKLGDQLRSHVRYRLSDVIAYENKGYTPTENVVS